MKPILNSIIAILATLTLCNCTSTVADYVPPARGTATGSIPVDWLTQVGTVSRIVPGSAAPGCAPSRNSVAATNPQWVTTAEGITVTTNRISGAEGYNHVASGTGNLLQGGGVLTGGIGIARGKLRSHINNNVNSRSGVHLGGCTDPNSPYIYGY
jgi:hypothetical protein